MSKPEPQGGPDYPDGCSQEGFVGGCERMGCHKPEQRVSSETLDRRMNELCAIKRGLNDDEFVELGYCLDLRDARARITELEAQAERLKKYIKWDGKIITEKTGIIHEMDQKLHELEAEVVKWKRIRTPTHGTCCTCQACGLDHDSCRCDLDEVADELEQVKAENARLRELVEKASTLIGFKSLIEGKRPG